MTVLDDLVAFARIEVESGDLEPWADLLRALLDRGYVTREGALWLVSLYNSYDALGSAWSVFERWDSPLAWATATDAADAGDYPCTNERRGLRGGRVVKRLESYAAHLAGQEQERWLRQGLRGGPQQSFVTLERHLRRVWGVGRQSAFEWAEFLGKVAGFPVAAPHAELWESEGPRRSLQRLYGNDSPSPMWLEDKAHLCRAHLAEHGVTLSWEDFETVICDFEVGRQGRYYPGRHLAALREEIDEIAEPHRTALLEVFMDIVPEPWRHIAPGIDKDLLKVYRDTGTLALPLEA